MFLKLKIGENYQEMVTVIAVAYPVLRVMTNDTDLPEDVGRRCGQKYSKISIPGASLIRNNFRLQAAT